MANLGRNFDANTVDPNARPDPVPAGRYKVMITKSTMRETKQKTGSFLELELSILEGQYQGQFLWARLNLFNPNPKAVEIAERELSAICHATGVMNVQDSEQLHGIAFLVDVVVDPGDDQYGPSNEIKKFLSLSEGAGQPAPQPAAQAPAQPAPAQAPAYQQPPQPAAAAAAGPTPPWRQ